MASATLEKAIFIFFGLSIFATIGIPIYNMTQELIVNDSITKDFDSFVNKIDVAIHVVESNNSVSFQTKVYAIKNLTITSIDNFQGIQIEFNNSRFYLERTIYSRTLPINMECNIEEGNYLLKAEVNYGFIFVYFLKE